MVMSWMSFIDSPGCSRKSLECISWRPQIPRLEARKKLANISTLCKHQISQLLQNIWPFNFSSMSQGWSKFPNLSDELYYPAPASIRESCWRPQVQKPALEILGNPKCRYHRWWALSVLFIVDITDVSIYNVVITEEKVCAIYTTLTITVVKPD